MMAEPLFDRKEFWKLVHKYPKQIRQLTFDLALRKTVATPAPYTYGQIVDFKIKVFNQGNVTAQNVEITDYIPSGFEYVNSFGWVFDGVNKATKIITTRLVPGDSIELTIQRFRDSKYVLLK